MGTHSVDYTLLIFVLTILLCGAYAGGYLSEKFRQPKVFGEILAGLMFGPTLFGHFFPDAYLAVFSESPSLSVALGAFSQVGLLLLMFCSGNELRSAALSRETESPSRELKTSLFIAATGMLIPFAIGIILIQLWDLGAYLGKAQNFLAFVLVFAIAIAITSIPVISRILYDLGILKSAFARTVLAAAVLEDVVLYVVLAVALSLVGGEYRNGFDLLSLTGWQTSQWVNLAYHTLITLVFLWLAFRVGPVLFRRLDTHRDEQTAGSTGVAFNLVFILVTTACAVFLGVSSIFGALVAGMILSGPAQLHRQTFEVIKSFAFAFFIPLYFVSVGLKLDLLRHFDAYFFAAFCFVACLAKLISVYVGAVLAGETRWGSLNLSVAMNARGGPGIVLAVVAFEAGIINESFYTSLVLLSLLTSFMAGMWLNLVIRRKWPLL